MAKKELRNYLDFVHISSARKNPKLQPLTEDSAYFRHMKKRAEANKELKPSGDK